MSRLMLFPIGFIAAALVLAIVLGPIPAQRNHLTAGHAGGRTTVVTGVDRGHVIAHIVAARRDR